LSFLAHLLNSLIYPKYRGIALQQTHAEKSILQSGFRAQSQLSERELAQDEAASWSEARMTRTASFPSGNKPIHPIPFSTNSPNLFIFRMQPQNPWQK